MLSFGRRSLHSHGVVGKGGRNHGGGGEKGRGGGGGLDEATKEEIAASTDGAGKAVDTVAC